MAIYYVDINNGLDTNNGSISSPFKTLNQAISIIATTGDTINLVPSTNIYSVTRTLSDGGFGTKSYTLQSTNINQNAIIDFSSITDNTDLLGTGTRIFKYLTFTNIQKWNNDNCKFYNCRLYGLDDATQSYFWTNSAVYFSYCFFKNFKNNVLANSSISLGRGSSGIAAQNCTFQNCNISYYSATVTISKCIIDSNCIINSALGTDYIITPIEGIKNYGCSLGGIKTSIYDMQIGDAIPCRYTVDFTNMAGYFSELGTCTASDMPLGGGSTPNGKFYFIKVDEGTLIADRTIQSSISWDKLNSVNYIEGTQKFLVDIDSVTSVTYTNFGAYLQLPDTATLTLATPQIITAFYLNGVTYADDSPDIFAFYGSNNNSSWTTLISNCTSVQTLYTFNNTTAYKYYKVVSTSSVNPNYVWCTISKGRFFTSKTENFIIRSLSGGCSYIDANNNSTTTNKSLGAWPSNNEWDSYIVNSTLSGKITPADKNIWNWGNGYAWCKDTPILNMGADTNRIIRGYSANNALSINLSSNASSYGFRPVLEFTENDLNGKVIY